MSSVTIENAQANLPALIGGLKPGDELVITQNSEPVAKLVGASSSNLKPRRPGSCQGMITIVSDDDDHLRDFAEYMP